MPFRGLGFGAGELSSRPEALLDDLVGCFAVEDALAPGVVGGVEAAEQLLKLGVRPDGDPSTSLPTRPLNLSTMPFVWGE